MAYIDPNTGGMIVQVVATSIAVLSGIGLVFARQIRMVFARLVRSLRGGSDRNESQEQGET
jgi:hypothetical protein